MLIILHVASPAKTQMGETAYQGGRHRFPRANLLSPTGSLKGDPAISTVKLKAEEGETTLSAINVHTRDPHTHKGYFKTE